jgi:hypothetical protein
VRFTPLYLALHKSLGSFSVDDSSQKSIIAITDGLNNQDIQPGTPVKATELAHVLSEWERRQQQIKMHLFRFALPSDETAEAGRSFQKIANRTGGTFPEVINGEALKEELLRQLVPRPYRVTETRPAAGAPPLRLEARLNDFVEIPRSRVLPNDYNVAVEGIVPKSVRLEGGEAIQLQVDHSGSPPEIAAIPYETPPPLLHRDLIAGSKAKQTDYRLRIYPPVRGDVNGSKSAIFRFSLQRNPDRTHFTPRPKEIWIEVTPLTDAGDEADPYIFYDGNFEPNEPVPVLRWAADDWPPSKEARLRIWCSTERADPLQEIALRDVVKLPDAHRPMQPMRGVPGVDLSIRKTLDHEEYRIRIVEKHGAKSPGIYSLKVALATDPKLKPSRVTHQFNPPGGLATHEFVYSAEDGAKIEQDPTTRITITKATAIKDNAMRPRDSVTVNVPLPGGTIETGTAAGQ